MQRSVWSDLWVSQQDDSTTLQSIYSMQWWWPLQRRRNKICWRIVKYMLSDFLEILILGKKRTTWYFMVSKQARTIHHKMDQGLWQQLESIDFIYISFYEWIQTVFSCENPFGVNILFFWQSHICSIKPDVSETDCCSSQLNRIWNHLSGHRTEIGWVCPLWNSGIIIESFLGNISRVSDQWRRLDCDTHKHLKSHNKIDVMKDIDAILSNVQSARQEALLYVFEDNEAVIKMNIKGRSPTVKHVSRTHRVAHDWLFDRINLDPRFKSNTLTPRINLQTSWPKGISNVMNGIICWPCLISAILALQLAPLRWQNELNKNQEKNVSQQNHDLWWFWPQERLRSCLLQPHQTRWGPPMDNKILENLSQVTMDRGNLCNPSIS